MASVRFASWKIETRHHNVKNPALCANSLNTWKDDNQIRARAYQQTYNLEPMVENYGVGVHIARIHCHRVALVFGSNIQLDIRPNTHSRHHK
jgi:hypothetical protein